jgi:tetratricopeptide (TPR) repeat protein
LLRLAGAAALCWLTAACQSNPAPDYTEVERQALLSGVAVFGEPVTSAGVEEVNILETSPEMERFVADSVGNTGVPIVKFRRLLRSLVEEGYFESTYEPETTRTAAETFEDKAGNCLSYTNMFIALVRELGLDARYQVVDVPPTWDADAGYLIRYSHVNVLVKGFSIEGMYRDDFSVDFNEVLPEEDQPKKEISDREATALFYANRSIQLMRAEQDREAFTYIRKALELDPDNANLWINLGAFYAKQKAYTEAIGAYEIALHHDRNHRGAISGLGRAHELLGNTEQAEFYGEQVRRYRSRNPYYHYAVAQMEFEREEYDKALEAINTAIDLKHRSGRFHFLKGLTQLKLGENDEAQSSFRKADRYGNFRDLKRRYMPDLATVQPQL